MVKKRICCILIIFLFIFSLLPIIIDNDNIVSAAWYNASWGYRKYITIDKDQVPSSLTNFPICINLASDSDLASKAQNDGDDILFTASDETTKLNHEIEYFNGATGQLIAWVNITSLSSVADTTIYMYYGNDAAGDQSNKTGTWDSDYIVVFHCEVASGYLNDSTNFGRNFIPYGSPAGYHATGKIGYGVDFDGSNDFFYNNTLDITGYDEMTLETWYNSQISHSSNRVDFLASLMFDTGPQDVRFTFRHGSSGNGDSGYTIYWDDGDASDEGGSDLNYDYATGYHYYATTMDDNDAVYGYRDHIQTISDTSISFNFNNNNENKHNIGRRCSGVNFAAGVMDEIRWSKIERSPDWLETTYNSIQNATSGGFYTLGPEINNGNSEPPTGFLATTQQNGNIFLNWTLGLNTSITRVETNTISVWTMGEGTLVYNGSDLDITHSSLSCNRRYYYMAWGFNTSSNNWSAPSSTNNISCPGDPTNVISNAFLDRLNITWSNNSYGWSTVLVRKNGGYPASVTDGTVLFNNTNETYEDVGVIYGTHYYTLFTYNKTINRYSTGYDVPIGSLRVNVYDINTSLPITNWSIFISNDAGTQVYESIQNNNTLIIDIDNLPLGDVTISINASEWDGTPNIIYPPRIYQMTLEENQGYVLNAYLIENGTTDDYFFIIVGPENEYGYEPPVEDATIYFRRYVNDTLGWVNISIRKTSASGIVSVNLVPLIQYHITIIKDGYQNFYDIFPPPIVDFEQDRYHTFRLVYEDLTQPQYYDIWEYITFTGTMTGPGYLQNGNITIYYGDTGHTTTNTRTYLYEINNGSATLKDAYYNTNNYFNRTIPNINTSRHHILVLWFNNTRSFTTSPPLTINIYPLYTYIRDTPLDLDTRIKNVVGPPPIGVTWYEPISVTIPIAVLCLLGVFNVGVGIVGSGLSIGLVQGLFAGYGITVNLGLFPLAGLIIVLGILLIMAKKEGVLSL